MATPPAHAPDARPTGNTRLTWAVRIVAMVLSAALGVVLLLLLFLVLSSLFGPHRDPHGYAIIFGAVLMFPVALLLTVVLPFCWPPGRRARAMLFTALGCLGSLAVGIGALVLAS